MLPRRGRSHTRSWDSSAQAVSLLILPLGQHGYGCLFNIVGCHQSVIYSVAQSVPAMAMGSYVSWLP